MAGLAIAACDPEGTLIVEQGNQLGSDFFAAMRADPVPRRELSGTAARCFWRETERYPALVQDGQFAITEWMPALGSYAAGQNLHILFDFTPFPLPARQSGKNFVLTGICRDELHRIEAEQYVDTTAAFAQKAAEGKVSVSLNLLVKNVGEHRVLCPGAAYRAFPGEGCSILEMPAGEPVSYPLLRRQALELFSRERTESGDLLLKVADRVCIRGRQAEALAGDRGYLLCSCLSADPLHAMERGEQLWRDALC